MASELCPFIPFWSFDTNVGLEMPESSYLLKAKFKSGGLVSKFSVENQEPEVVCGHHTDTDLIFSGADFLPPPCKSKRGSTLWPDIWSLLLGIIKKILPSWGIRVGMEKKIRHGKIMWFWYWFLVILDVYPSRFTNLFPRGAVGIISTSYSIWCRVHIRPALACTIPGHVPWKRKGYFKKKCSAFR